VDAHMLNPPFVYEGRELYFKAGSAMPQKYAR
jgi:hypothetical protein